METHDIISEHIPPSGWLFKYVKFTSGLEACTRFQFFTACCVLGASFNNRIWIHRGDKELLPKLFPNPWIILLAPPGRGHKTSTISMGVNILQKASPDTRILADKLTPESLVKALSEPNDKEMIRIGPRDATGLIKAPELSVFFGRQTYNVGLVSLITDLYDYREEWVSETIMRGKSVLRKNCISILGGSTPDWLQTKLPDDAFEGGFMSRYIIVEMPPKYFKRIAEPVKPDDSSLQELITELAEMRVLAGEMEWTSNGRAFYRHYYENLIPTGLVQQDAYQEREVEQVIKIAMLLALCDQEMTVHEKHMQYAHKLITLLMEETAPRIERLTTHPRMKTAQDIQDLLRMHNKMSQKQLLGKLYRGLAHGEQQFNEALRILRVTGIVDFENNVYTLTKRRKKSEC